MLLWSNLGVEPAWLLRETGNSALEADPRIPPNNKKKMCQTIQKLFPNNEVIFLPHFSWFGGINGSALGPNFPSP